MNCLLLSRVSGKAEVNTCDVSNSFWASKMVMHYCNILIYKHVHTLILSISAPILTNPRQAYSLILPNQQPPILSIATTHTSNSKLKWLTQATAKYRMIQQGTDSGKRSFCTMGSVKVTPILQNNLLKSWQLQRW